MDARGIMEHVEQAGVHSGDSACAIPPPSLSAETQQTIVTHTRRLADSLGVVGLLNVQFAVKAGEVFVIEANPRASRTVPFVAKATGVSLAKAASRVMAGETLDELVASGMLPGWSRNGQLPSPASADGAGGGDAALRHVAVKEAVLPFGRFPCGDTVLGPEMRSTGEVMGIDATFGLAFAKSQIAAGDALPSGGTVLLTLADRDKPEGLEAARVLSSSASTSPRRPAPPVTCEATAWMSPSRWRSCRSTVVRHRRARTPCSSSPQAGSSWSSTRQGVGGHRSTVATSGQQHARITSRA